MQTFRRMFQVCTVMQCWVLRFVNASYRGPEHSRLTMTHSYAQLLVHLDATAHAQDRTKVARLIGEVQGSAITALYAVTPAVFQVPLMAETGPQALSLLREMDDERRAKVRAMLERSSGVGPRIMWAAAEGYGVIPEFARQALYADLLVLGQYDASDDECRDVPPDFVESVIAASGKPALVVPYTGVPTPPGDIIAIAWKPTRESARAVAAAVPLLQRARQVHVLSWGEAAESSSGLGLDAYLKLRRIEPMWHREGGPEPEPLGDILLSRASDLGCDLLVMGCYGHSRAREWVLGGTSRTVLRSMTLPVLMAH
jgi:nucleotide-binding universal stress UspA family protein